MLVISIKNMEQRLLLAIILSIAFLFGWQNFFPQEVPEEAKEKQFLDLEEDNKTQVMQNQSLEEDFLEGKRIKIENNYLKGSINLLGASIDNLLLKKYKEDSSDKKVELLAPNYSSEPNFIKIRWFSKNKEIELPDNRTLWEGEKNGDKIILSWLSNQGLLFKIELSLDDKYLFKVDTKVDFSGAPALIEKNIKIRGQIIFERTRRATITDNMILHEGAIALVNGKLKEINFKDIDSENYKNSKGERLEWIGFSDKYWLVSVINKKEGALGQFTSSFSDEWQENKYKMNFLLPSRQIDNVIEESFLIFAGAKSIEILDFYSQSLGITNFDKAVDLGFLYFITKPIFLLLNYFYKVLGNFGLAILLLTIITKVLLFPLAYKSVRSMNKIKEIQPKINKLKEQYANNAQLFQQSLLSLYKKEKVNPASGCLPIILQMPIFFALYKVLFVTLEMRQAPFYGWIQDLSAPDTTSLFNLFGLISWSPPQFLMIGVLPIAMSFTMFLQQRLQPAPSDPTQAMVMKLLPLFLLFMFSQFPSGLLIYWTWSNLLSLVQQWIIKYLPES
jgi:YidC/Oxa1 family membrane protein insertase